MLAAIGLGLALYLRYARRALHDPRLVQDKLSRDACRVELRLAVIASGHTSESALRARLERLAAAYRPFALAAGNSFVPRYVQSEAPDLRVVMPLGKGCLLNVREMA